MDVPGQAASENVLPLPFCSVGSLKGLDGTHSHWAGFPGATNGKEHDCQCRRRKRHGSNPWVKKIPWRRALQYSCLEYNQYKPAPIFLPGDSRGQRSLEDYCPLSHKKSDMTEVI